MEPVERRTNTFAALGANDKKKKTGPPTVASVQQHQKAPQVFVRSRDLIEGSWADDSFDDQPVAAKNGVIVDADGFMTKPAKGKKATAAAFTSVMETPVADAGFDDDEEEEEPEVSEESSEEEEEEAPSTAPAPVAAAAEKKVESKEPVLSKKDKKKKEAEELEALLQELALETKSEAVADKSEEAEAVDAEGGAGENGAAAKKKKKKKAAKKKEDGGAEAGEANKPAAEPAAAAAAPVKKAVKKEAPKKSAVELAAIKEAKEREEKMKKKSKAKKLDFEFIN